MNPNRPHKPTPRWITAEWKNKARKPHSVQPRFNRGERIEELRLLVVDFSIPFHRREKLAAELSELLRKVKNDKK